MEVDDVIASYALSNLDNTKVIISSADSDYFQLVSENVEVFRYRGKKGAKSIRFNRDLILEQYNINPEYFADYKSLVGDASDNIKGVFQVGPKTAASLINQFGGIEDIILNVEDIKTPKIKESIRKSIDLIRKNYLIIKLRKEKLVFELNELKYVIDHSKTVMDVAKEIKLFD